MYSKQHLNLHTFLSASGKAVPGRLYIWMDWNDASPKVSPNILDRPLVAGHSTEHKPQAILRKNYWEQIIMKLDWRIHGMSQGINYHFFRLTAKTDSWLVKRMYWSLTPGLWFQMSFKDGSTRIWDILILIFVKQEKAETCRPSLYMFGINVRLHILLFVSSQYCKVCLTCQRVQYGVLLLHPHTVWERAEFRFSCQRDYTNFRLDGPMLSYYEGFAHMLSEPDAKWGRTWVSECVRLCVCVPVWVHSPAASLCTDHINDGTEARATD